MLPNLIFSDEKLFTVEAAFNHRNDRVLLKSLQDIPPGLKKGKDPKASLRDGLGSCVFRGEIPFDFCSQEN